MPLLQPRGAMSISTTFWNASTLSPKRSLMEADRAARTIVGRVERNVGLIAFPWPMRLATWFLASMPWRLAEFVSGILPEKNADGRNISF